MEGRMNDVLHLYEVINGWTGESYTRVYVWAADEAMAIDLARASYHAEAAASQAKALGSESSGDAYPPAYWMDLRIRHLFSAADPPFATQPSNSGWKQEERSV
jgi:hypothetical protein